MNETESALRLECLKLALVRDDGKEAIAHAKAYFAFISGTNDIRDVGPEENANINTEDYLE